MKNGVGPEFIGLLLAQVRALSRPRKSMVALDLSGYYLKALYCYFRASLGSILPTSRPEESHLAISCRRYQGADPLRPHPLFKPALGKPVIG